MKCAQCGSEDVVKARLAYEMSTSTPSITPTIGIGGNANGSGVFGGLSANQFQSQFARKLAPPKDIQGEGCGAVVLYIILFSVITYFVGNYDTNAIEVFLIFFLPAVVAFWAYRSMREDGREKREAEQETYEKLWVCLRCGHVANMQEFSSSDVTLKSDLPDN